MKKLFVLLLVSVVMLSGCGESEQEKANYEAIEAEAKDFWGPGGPGPIIQSARAERERQRKLTDEQKAAEKKEVKETPTSTSWVSDPSDPNNVKIEKAIRESLKKPTGKLTKADLGKVYGLYLTGNQLTDVKGLENLTQLKDLDLSKNQLTSLKGLEKFTQLKYLWLTGNPDLTKAQIAELQKALPKCFIHSNPKK